MAKYKALDVANWFIAKAAESGDVVTHLKIQKLLYYAEAWTQVAKNTDLFEEKMQAWAHGPVVPEVFQAFKSYGWNPLPIPQNERIPELDSDFEDILNDVFEAYGELPAKTLEAMTHADDPWIKARGGIDPEARCENVIPKEEVREFFTKKYLENE